MADIVKPTVEELSALMRARTRGEFSDQGVFNTQTRPTAAEASDLIDLATTVVGSKVGAAIDAALVGTVTAAIKFKAAALIEANYYPEQASAENSAYSLWQAQYAELMTTIDDVTPGNTSATPGFGAIPSYGRDGGPYDPTAVPVDPWFP